MNILIAILVVTAPLTIIGLWFTCKVFVIAKSQVKLRKSIDAGDLDAVKKYFEDFAERHNKGREQS